MIKMKPLLASVLLAVSGVASAEITLYNPISMPPTGYEQGCDYAFFKLFSYSGYFDIPQLRNDETYYVYPSFTGPYQITCSQGMLSANAASNEAFLTYFYD